MNGEDPYPQSFQPWEAPYAHTLEPSKHSGFGIASFVMALVLGLILFALVVVAGVMEASTPGGMDEESPAAIVVGLGIIGASFASLVGLVFGIVGVCATDRRKVFGWLGVGIHACLLLGVAGLVAVGLMMS